MSNLATLKKKAAEFEQKRQFDRALEAYEEVLRLQDGTEDADVALYNRVGDMQLRLGRSHEALRSYERAVDLYSDRGFLNNAIALCNKILRQDPLRAQVHYKLGRASAIKGFRSDARQHLVEYAALMQKAGRDDEAFAALAELVEVGSEMEDLRLLLIDQLERHGRIADAIVQLERVVDSATRAGRPADAIAARERIQTLDPEYAGAAESSAATDADAGAVAGRMPDLVLIEPTAYAPATTDTPESGARVSRGIEMPVGLMRGMDAEAIPADTADFAMPDLEPTAFEGGYEVATDPDLIVLDGLGEPVADAEDDRVTDAARTEPVPEDGATFPVFIVEDDAAPDLVLHVSDDAQTDGDEADAPVDLTFIDVDDVVDVAPRGGPAAHLHLVDPSAGSSAEPPADGVRRVRPVTPASALQRSAMPTPIAVRPVPTTPISSRPVADPAAAPTNYIDLGELLRDDDGERSTRMVTEERAPSGDEQADFAVMLRKFKQGVAEHVDDEDYDSHYDLGIAFREMGLLDEAIAGFQRALRGTTRRARTYEALGQCFLDRGQHSVAMAVLQRALTEGNLGDEQLVGVLYLLGRTAEAMNQRDDAVRYYERVLAVDITFADVADRMGLVSQVPR